MATTPIESFDKWLIVELKGRKRIKDNLWRLTELFFAQRAGLTWQLKANAIHFWFIKEGNKAINLFTAFYRRQWVSSENKPFNWTWHWRLFDLLQFTRNIGGGAVVHEAYYNKFCRFIMENRQSCGGPQGFRIRSYYPWVPENESISFRWVLHGCVLDAPCHPSDSPLFRNRNHPKNIPLDWKPIIQTASYPENKHPLLWKYSPSLQQFGSVTVPWWSINGCFALNRQSFRSCTRPSADKFPMLA